MGRAYGNANVLLSARSGSQTSAPQSVRVANIQSSKCSSLEPCPHSTTSRIDGETESFTLNSLWWDPRFVFWPRIANFGLENVIAWHSLLLSKVWGLAIASKVTGTILAVLPMFYLELTKPILSINNTLIGLISSAVTRSVYWEKCRREKHLLKIGFLNLNYASTKESYAKQARICACPL